MPHYRDTAGGIHFLPDAKFIDLLPGGCVEISEAEANTPLPPPVPAMVTARQLRLWLAGAGLLDQVATALAAIPDATARTTAEIEWEYATTFARSHSLIASVGSALGLSDADIDAAFAAASKI